MGSLVTRRDGLDRKEASKSKNSVLSVNGGLTLSTQNAKSVTYAWKEMFNSHLICQDDASTPNSPVQQSEVPQTLLNPLQLFDAPAVGNTQWDNTQYQAYGQGYGATFDPAYSPEMLSSLSVGYNMPNQMWTQGYDMSFNSFDFAGTMSNAAGGYTQDQMYGQGYITSPDLSFSSGTMSNPLGVYTPNQQWGQGHNIPFDSSYFLAALPNPTGGYAQNQANYQRGSPSLSDPPFQPGDAGTTVPKSKPLRPLLPRDKDAPPPPPPPQSESEDDDEDESQESSGYRAWLKSQPAYRDAVKKVLAAGVPFCHRCACVSPPLSGIRGLRNYY
ncbi:hypothetical protein CHU98_g6731 [Xylaria longipes]|nr:hypothetical protein CHU98_g6731 [Xylaria longipes]